MDPEQGYQLRVKVLRLAKPAELKEFRTRVLLMIDRNDHTWDNNWSHWNNFGEVIFRVKNAVGIRVRAVP